MATDAFAEASQFMSSEAVAEFAGTLESKLQQLSGQMRLGDP